MRQSNPKAWLLAAMVFAVPARALAVWPPSTSLVVESEVSNSDSQTGKLPPTLRQDVQAATDKIQQDQRRLEKVIEDLKNDEAALKSVRLATPQ